LFISPPLSGSSIWDSLIPAICIFVVVFPLFHCCCDGDRKKKPAVPPLDLSRIIKDEEKEEEPNITPELSPLSEATREAARKAARDEAAFAPDFPPRVESPPSPVEQEADRDELP
jgi:hypothetical protein